MVTVQVVVRSHSSLTVHSEIHFDVGEGWWRCIGGGGSTVPRRPNTGAGVRGKTVQSPPGLEVGDYMVRDHDLSRTRSTGSPES